MGDAKVQMENSEEGSCIICGRFVSKMRVEVQQREIKL